MSARAWVALAAVGLSACETQIASTRDPLSSFRVEVVCAGKDATECPTVAAGAAECPAPTSPAVLGEPKTPVDRTQRFYVAQVSAIGPDGLAAAYEGTANVYVMFDGSVSPARDALMPPMATLKFTGGRGCLTATIPPAFNKAELWVEDSGPARKKGSFAVGVSKPIFRPSPLISDIQTTTDAAFTMSPLNNKHVLVEGGTDGKPIVVTAVSAQSFAVTDTGAPGPDHPWGSLLVYSFSQPRGVQVGMKVTNLNGTLGEFNGLTELNFPIWDLSNDPPELSLLPAPHEIKVEDIPKTLEKMEPFESALVVVKQWVVCALAPGRDLDAYNKYGQWKAAPSADKCGDSKTSVSVVSQSTVPGFNPLANATKTVCSLEGILSHVVPGKGVNLWMINPRDSNDLDPSLLKGSSDDCPKSN